MKGERIKWNKWIGTRISIDLDKRKKMLAFEDLEPCQGASYSYRHCYSWGNGPANSKRDKLLEKVETISSKEKLHWTELNRKERLYSMLLLLEMRSRTQIWVLPTNKELEKFGNLGWENSRPTEHRFYSKLFSWRRLFYNLEQVTCQS
jgi:hypothetical protein